MTIEQTLAERQDRYGEFADHARISQNLSAVMHAAPRWDGLSAAQKEALEMVQHKVARILNGDPDYADNWHDIAGYATLVENTLKERTPTPVAEASTILWPTLLDNAWMCSHGDPSEKAGVMRVAVGEACPVCFATK